MEGARRGIGVKARPAFTPPPHAAFWGKHGPLAAILGERPALKGRESRPRVVG
jgi:hypothetical protein